MLVERNRSMKTKSENKRNRFLLPTQENDQDLKFDPNKLNRLASNTVSRIPNTDDEHSTKKNVEDFLRQKHHSQIQSNIRKLLQGICWRRRLQSSKLNKHTNVDTTVTKFPRTGGYL